MVLLPNDLLKETTNKTLWREQLEHDACGVGFVVDVSGHPTHKVL